MSLAIPVAKPKRLSFSFHRLQGGFQVATLRVQVK
jgi:hypothetical protein